MFFKIIIKSIGNKKEKRLKIIVNKYYSKKAVERNLIKRRLRAVLRPFVLKYQDKQFLVFVYPISKNLNFWQLKNEVEKILQEKL